MKDKEKQIEEMANIIHRTEFVDISGYEEEKIAEELLKYYQPKLPEDSVVLSRENYEAIKEGSYQQGWIDGNSYEIVMDELTLQLEQARKETAEKIFNAIYNSYGAYMGKHFYDLAKQFDVEVGE